MDKKKIFSDQLADYPQFPSPKKEKMYSLTLNISKCDFHNQANAGTVSTHPTFCEIYGIFVKHMESTFYRVSNEVFVIEIF